MSKENADFAGTFFTFIKKEDNFPKFDFSFFKFRYFLYINFSVLKYMNFLSKNIDYGKYNFRTNSL